MNNYRTFFIATVLGSTLLASNAWAADANVLTGTGHIDLKLNPSAPAIVPAAGPRFVWRNNTLFLGDAQSSQSYDSPFVFLMGQGTAASDSVVIFGSAGTYGTAIGAGAFANSSVSIGRYATASGSSSVAIGTVDNDDNNNWAAATGYGAIAIGPFSHAAASYSTAIGSDHITSLGSGSTALGRNVNITGAGSSALGSFLSISGDGSTALGSSALVTGDYAAAIGYNASATADYSFATGRTTTFAHGSVALGYFNKGNKRKDNTTTVDPVTPHNDDPLLTLGNGTSSTAANAFTVYRDGTVRLAKAAGGISMGQFN